VKVPHVRLCHSRVLFGQLRLIRPAPQRPEPEPIDTLEAVGAIRLMAFPVAR
jgi:hypothetical protein